MTQETLLLTTSDNHIIALKLEYNNVAEKHRKIRLYEQLCENWSYKDFFSKYNGFVRAGTCADASERNFFKEVDTNNTEFLEKEIHQYDFVKSPENYQNNIAENNYPASVASKPYTVHFDNRVDDSEIPQLIKNLGYKIEPEDNVYDVSFNAVKQSYEIVGLNRRRASVNVGKKRVKFIRNHLTFPPAEYAVMQRLLSQWNNSRRANPNLSIRDFCRTISNAKERSLFSLYAIEQTNVNSRLLFLKHELTHVKNSALQAGFGLKKNTKRLSVEDYYRLQVEDERSAYLSQVVNAANTYVKQGNSNDFSMFDVESSALVAALKSMPEDRRFSYALNPENLIDSAFKSFTKNHRGEYDKGQFVNNMKLEMQKVPMSAEADENHEEFFKRRSLYYRYKLYNPQTQSYEHKNFTPFVEGLREVSLSQENIANIITPCQQIVSRRLAEFNRDKSRGLINSALVEDAKALMRDNLHKSRLINNINGMEISELSDDKPQVVSPSPQQPRKPAKWSRDIEAYWSKFDGYKEIANNEDEYYFSINKNKIRYTAKDKVQMGKDAEYDMYVKLLKEPSNQNKPIIFKDTLTKEQALKLYVACVNNNRQMKGAVPKDFSLLKKLRDIPAADLQKCQRTICQNNQQNQILQRQIMSQAGR